MTDFTGKQMRNGADSGDGTRETGATDWEGPISSMDDRAKTAGAYRIQQAYDTMFITPFGEGTNGGVYMNPGGDFWAWDEGLAIFEQGGEWSQPGVHANNSPNSNTPSNVTGKGGS